MAAGDGSSAPASAQFSSGSSTRFCARACPTTRTIDLGNGETAQVAAVTQLPPGRGSGLPRRRPHHRGPDRALARPASRHPPPLGLAARAAVAAGSRSRRRRGLGRSDPRRDRAGARLGQARHRSLLLPPRRGRGDPHGRALAVRLVGAARFLGRPRQQLCDAARLFRDRAARRRPHICDGQWRHRPFGRLGARALRRGRRRHHEGHELGTAGRGRRRNSWPAFIAGLINGWLTAYVGLPAFIATLGTFYWARGIGSSIVAGTQLNGFPESFNLIGRNLYELLDVMGIAPAGGLWLALAKAVSVQTIFVLVVALVAGDRARATPPSDRRSTPSAATSGPRISPASIRGGCVSRRS